MAEWALDICYAHYFNRNPPVDKAFLLTGAPAYESALLDLVERIVVDYPTLRRFSLPSIRRWTPYKNKLDFRLSELRASARQSASVSRRNRRLP